MDVRIEIERTQVDDRDSGEPFPVYKDSALVDGGQYIGLCGVTRRRNDRTRRTAAGPVAVIVEAAYAFVQTYELLGGDHAALKRFQTILHPDVVVRRFGLRVAIGVHEGAPLRLLWAAVGVAADAVPPKRRIVNDGGRKACSTIVRVSRKKLRQERRHPGVAVTGRRVPADRRSLGFREQRAIGRSEIVGPKQPAILGLDPRADGIRVTA